MIGNSPGVTGGGGAQAGFVHDYLTVTDPSDTQVARVASEVISWKRAPGSSTQTGRWIRSGGSVNKLVVTIDQREAATVHGDLVREAFTDLALLPFYFQVTPLLTREGVTGPEGGVQRERELLPVGQEGLIAESHE